MKNKVLSLCLAMALAATPVLADTVSTSTTVNGQSSVSNKVEVTMKPVEIKVTVPVGGASFHINPNADIKGGEELVTVNELNVINEGFFPIYVKLDNMKAKEGTTQKVTHKDEMGKAWADFTKSDCQNMIGFNFATGSGGWHLPTESVEQKNGGMTWHIYGGNSRNIAPVVLTGYAWEEADTLEYQMDLIVSLEGTETP